MRILHYIFLMLVIFVASCRVEDYITPSTSSNVGYYYSEVGDIKGLFLLNEGNMGSNKATLDYFDYESGEYSKNIFAERNPMVTYELGDVGNDLQIYDDRVYAVINCSNLVEVMTLSTAEHIGSVSIPNCRYIAFKDDYAYVSSYAGEVQLDQNARLGYVAKIDLSTLLVVEECAVGYQPEELVVVNDKLYVANSGGYLVPDYDNTISVIALDTFTEIKQIEVAINLHRLELDNYGYLWVSSRGDYYDTPSKTFVVDPTTDEVVKEFDVPNSDMCIDDDMLYIYSSNSSWSTSSTQNSSTLIDTKSQMVVDGGFITDGTDSQFNVAYSIAVNPETKEIFITDARDYVTPGKLYCYSSDGSLRWSVTTGDIPSRIAFTTKKLDPIN